MYNKNNILLSFIVIHCTVCDNTETCYSHIFVYEKYIPLEYLIKYCSCINVEAVILICNILCIFMIYLPGLKRSCS